MVRYYACELDSIYGKENTEFAAVYAFYDEYDNLLYIGKTNNLKLRMGQHFAFGHLKDDQYRQVKKVMYHKCNSVTDAIILETILIAYHKPPFNKRDIGELPTVISAEEIISSLDWEVYFDEQVYTGEEKDELVFKMISYDDWDYGKQKNLLEESYRRYVLNHISDEDKNLKKNYEILFEMVLVKAIGHYDNLKDRKDFCQLIHDTYLPGIGIKWHKFCRKHMNVDRFKTYGDIDRAFATNPHISRELAETLSQKRWVHPLDEYDFGTLEAPEIERISWGHEWD